MLCGQKLEKVGPIERPLKHRSREDPFPLPQGLKWTWLNSEEAMRLDPRKERIKAQWITSHPNFKNHYYWGVVCKWGNAILSFAPDFVNVGGKLFSVMSLEPSSQSIELMRSTSYDDTPLQMASEMLKEVVNSTKKEYILQTILWHSLHCQACCCHCNVALLFRVSMSKLQCTFTSSTVVLLNPLDLGK